MQPQRRSRLREVTSLWFSALVAVSLYLAEKLTLFEAALLVYLLYLSTCYLPYLSTILPQLLVVVERTVTIRYTVTPHSCPTWTNQPVSVCQYTVYTLPTKYIMLQISFIITQNKQHLRGITIFNNICICFAVRHSVFLSVFNYMLNTSSTQWCKKIKISRKKNICFISTKLEVAILIYSMSRPNLPFTASKSDLKHLR